MEAVGLQTHWGVLVGLYLFLGGLAAGTLCVSAIINLKTDDTFKKTVRFGAWSGTILLIAGVLFLVAETRMPLRALMLWSAFTNPSSWMTRGAWLLVAGVILFGIWALAHTERVTDKLPFLKKWTRPLAWAVAVVAAGIAAYTGVLLSVLVAHPLWSTFWLPVLFTVSAMDTGVALVSGYATLKEPKDTEGLESLKAVFEKSTVILIALELAVLAVLLVSVMASGTVGAASVMILAKGPLAVYFWGLLVVLGLLAPLALSILTVRKKERAAKTALVPVASAALCLTGGLTLRFLILLAGLPVHL